MSSLTESILEQAALAWFGELGYAVGHGPQFPTGATPAQALSHGERESYGELLLVGPLREAIRLLNPAIPQSHNLATLRETQLPKLLSGELQPTITP